LKKRSYDLHGSWESVTGINAPLYAGPRDASQQLNVDAIIKYWLSQGCSRDKLNVGIPLYGRTFTLANRSNHEVGAPSAGPGRCGTFTTETGFLGFNEILYNIETQGWNRYWEDKQQVPYAVHGDQWVGYDDAQSVKAKLDYIRRNNLGGVMFWSIETDDFNNVCGKGRYPLIKLARYSSLQRFQKYFYEKLKIQ
jgi:chitinase